MSHIKNKYNLSSREVQAAILLCRGFNNEEIAEALSIKQGTVKTHLRNLYRSFHVSGKVLLILAIIDDVMEKFYITKTPPPEQIPIRDIPSKTDLLMNVPDNKQHS